MPLPVAAHHKHRRTRLRRLRHKLQRRENANLHRILNHHGCNCVCGNRNRHPGSHRRRNNHSRRRVHCDHRSRHRVHRDHRRGQSHRRWRRSRSGRCLSGRSRHLLLRRTVLRRTDVVSSWPQSGRHIHHRNRAHHQQRHNGFFQLHGHTPFPFEDSIQAFFCLPCCSHRNSLPPSSSRSRFEFREKSKQRFG